jgi:hypothetical protein
VKRILLAMMVGALVGAMAAQAKLPPPAPKSDAEKAAAAEKDAATKAKEAADLAKAQDKAVANYKRSHASMGKETKAKK